MALHIHNTQKPDTMQPIVQQIFLLYLAFHRKIPCLHLLWVSFCTSQGRLESGDAWSCPVTQNVDFNFNIYEMFHIDL